MLDPITAMGVAGNVVQFVEFTCTLLSKTRKIYRSDFGMPAQYLSVQIIADDLSSLSSRLGQNLSVLSGVNGHLSESEKALDDINKHCAEEAKSLLFALGKLQQSGKHKAWGSFKIALQSVWNPEKIDRLVERLAAFRKALDTHILIALREENNLAHLQQSDDFARLNGTSSVS